MTETSNQQEVSRGVSVLLTNDVGELQTEIEEFMPGMRKYYKKFLNMELQPDKEYVFRIVLSDWNIFLQLQEDVQARTSAIISSDIQQDITKFNNYQIEQGELWVQGHEEVIDSTLRHWNKFLQARARQVLVTRLDVCLTGVGLFFYILDLVSDLLAAVNFGYNHHWWRAMVTCALVYGAVIVSTSWKWINEEIHCTGAADWLRYVASLLVNWPDLEQYRALCRVEWRLHKSPAGSAHLVPEWHQRRSNVTYLKLTEGLWEACPQAILQVYLLLADLYGAWTWTDYLRIAGASVSLCSAGAALINLEKSRRIYNNIDLPPSELVVLHVWAVPVTVSRLLSVTLLLSVHLYWALAGVALHLLLYTVYWCTRYGVPQALRDVLGTCLVTLRFFLTPYIVAGSTPVRAVYHAVHLLVNTAMMVVWALGTPLVCAHPALYTAIIYFNAVMFAVGLVGCTLHGQYWPHRYRSY